MTDDDWPYKGTREEYVAALDKALGGDKSREARHGSVQPLCETCGGNVYIGCATEPEGWCEPCIKRYDYVCQPVEVKPDDTADSPAWTAVANFRLEPIPETAVVRQYTRLCAGVASIAEVYRVPVNLVRNGHERNSVRLWSPWGKQEVKL